jgi:hypothetical protein
LVEEEEEQIHYNEEAEAISSEFQPFSPPIEWLHKYVHDWPHEGGISS